MAKRLASLAGLLSILVAVPIFLSYSVGTPALNWFPDLSSVGRAIDLRWVPLEWAVSILALVAWALWAYLSVAVLIRIAGHAERRLRAAGWIWRASETLAWSPVKMLVDVALGAALLTSTISHSSARAASSQDSTGWSAVIAPHVAAIRSEANATWQSNGARHSMTSEKRRSVPSRRKSQTGEANQTYVVRPGDSLWSIAEAKLGDPYRWTEIWKLNRDLEVADGYHLSRPGFIQPGWRLRLPGTESAAGQPSKDKERCAPTDVGEMASAPEKPQVSPSPVVRLPEVDPRHDDRVELPSGSAITVGFIAGFLSAIGLSELLRRRHRHPRKPSSGWPRTRPRHDLKARFMRAVNAAEYTHAKSDPSERLVKRVQSPAGEIILGHRQAEPVVASQRGCVYSFSGPPQDVLSYLQDLAVHAALSHRGQVEVWTTQEFDLSGLPSLRVFGDARTLVSELEIEILKRHRLFDEEGAQAWEGHQENWADDPLALVLGIVSGSDRTLQNRFRAVATQGHDLGIIVLTVADEDATLRIDGHLVQPLERDLGLGVEPFQAIHLTEADRLEVLTDLAPKRPGSESAKQAAESQKAPQPAATTDAPIRVKLFGRPTIGGVDEHATDGFGPKSREFLYLFLLNPEGLTREEAIETLWPETETEQGVERFKFQLKNVRNHLRNDLAPTAKFIDKVGDVYRPLSQLFWVDIWQFDLHLAEADGPSAIESLSHAVELYRGDLLHGLYYEWADPLRRHFRERLLDVLVRLSDLRSAAGDYEGALRAILRAIEADRYAEHFYRRAMTIYGRLGRASDIQRIYRELVAALADELDAEPDSETSDLKDHLLQQLSQST
jgi:DNA-binding SARP family transcriptional activator